MTTVVKILIVDDEPAIRQLIRRYAELEDYEVSEAGNGFEAVELCRKGSFDVIVMDIMMPDMDGFAATREIHKHCDMPVLMLSARGTEVDKLYSFELGIDDYVVKPFSPRELMARLKVIVMRNGQDKPAPKNLLALGGLEIDRDGRNVNVNGERVVLTPKEYDLLLYLAENRGIVLTREQILNAVWGYDFIGEDRTVDWQIKLLRGKLGECRDIVKTMRGVGYKLEA